MKKILVSLLTLFLITTLAGCNLRKAKSVQGEDSQALVITSEVKEALSNPEKIIRICGKEESEILNKYVKSKYGGSETYALQKLDSYTLDNSTIVIAYVQGMYKLGGDEKRLGYNLAEMDQGIKAEGKFVKKYVTGSRITLVFGAKDLNTLDSILKEFFNKINTGQNTSDASKGEVKKSILYFPANSDRGFQWGYYLVIPSDKYKEENKDHKRYIMIDTNNTGETNNYDECKNKTEAELAVSRQYSMQVAEKLWIPLLYPVFPRPSVKSYKYKGEVNKFLTHSFDRDTATLHLKLKEPDLKKILADQFNEAGFDVNKLIRLDLQLSAMMDDAIKYLNQKGENVQSGKAFLCGYSSSGTFVDRFSVLNPERVKAVAAGATLDDMVLPLAEYKGEKLIFPIGTYDYKDITGKEFDLETHNQAARLVFMGKDDGGTHNTVMDQSCYGDTERDTIVKLWGADVLPRAQALMELYGKSGGRGMFILDKGIGHSYSSDMKDYILNFFKANRDTDVPEYPKPANSNQLEYILH